MQHTIGNVILDDTYYPGEDLYSDGPVEEELLKIAEAHREAELNAVIAAKKSWPVLYHFSHIRQNILEWIPFTKEDKVLEIGAGCGAITGAIAKKAGSVTCIDLSMQRSKINANRNREYDNIRILVGNFRDIEADLTEKYDYITLIGVFEYAEGYMGTQEPYLDMLKCIRKHLAPGGKIVLAIENRLGLKYWAGCTEDHIGQYFKGLEGYPDSSGVRTFSHKELQDLFDRAGGLSTAFYYPYPDYKLPMTIYSDAKLPEEGEITDFVRNYDRGRTALFSEPKVWNSLLSAGLFPEFSNSFLVIAENTEAPKAETAVSEELLYSKYSNERSRRFAIRTDILRRGGELIVTKTALYPVGQAHVQRIPEWETRLNEQYAKVGYECNRSQWNGEQIVLEFVHNETVEKQLDSLVACGKVDEANALLVDCLEKIAKVYDDEDFVRTEAFEQVFGKAVLPEGLRSGKVTNIDLLCQNLVLDTATIVLDYEWTYDFPIPASFVQYRMIHYLVNSGAGREAFHAEELYRQVGITPELAEEYAKMEAHFQKSLTEGHTPIRELYDAISPGVYPFEIKEPEQFQIFFDLGEGYREKDSVKKAIRDEKISWTLNLPENCRSIRLDPGNVPCMMVIRQLTIDDAPVNLETAVIPNGVRSRNWVTFEQADPNISLIPVPEGAKKLTIQCRVLPGSSRAMAHSRQLEDENRELRQKIEELKHPLYWKVKHQAAKMRERKR